MNKDCLNSIRMDEPHPNNDGIHVFKMCLRLETLFKQSLNERLSASVSIPLSWTVQTDSANALKTGTMKNSDIWRPEGVHSHRVNWKLRSNNKPVHTVIIKH